MKSINNDRYFLILENLNLYPELDTNIKKAVEQIMNAILLIHEENISFGIKEALKVKEIYENHTNISYFELIKKFNYLLRNYKIEIVNGENVRPYYGMYNNSETYTYGKKQDIMNLEFFTMKKLSYKGGKIELERTFFNWIYKKIHQEKINTSNDQKDFLINNLVIHYNNMLIDLENAILKETNEFIKGVK